MSESSTHATVIFIGIAGPSGCGKSTYAKHLADHLHSPLYPIVLDHFCIDPLIVNHPILGQIESYEQPDCFNINDFSNLLNQIKQNPKLITRYHREDILINENETIFIIIEGFLLFALSDQITNLFDIKIFLDSTLSECRVQRYRRRNKIDQTIPNETIIVTEQFQQWFDYLVWDEYLKRRDLQLSKAEKIFYSNEYQQKQYISLDDYIAQRVREIIMHKTNNIV
jgi:uridine kinase